MSIHNILFFLEKLSPGVSSTEDIEQDFFLCCKQCNDKKNYKIHKAFFWGGVSKEDIC